MNLENQQSEEYDYIRKQRNKVELEKLLGVHRHTLAKMLEESKDELGPPIGKSTYSILQVEYLVHKYGILKRKIYKKNEE